MTHVRCFYVLGPLLNILSYIHSHLNNQSIVPLWHKILKHSGNYEISIHHFSSLCDGHLGRHPVLSLIYYINHIVYVTSIICALSRILFAVLKKVDLLCSNLVVCRHRLLIRGWTSVCSRGHLQIVRPYFKKK